MGIKDLELISEVEKMSGRVIKAVYLFYLIVAFLFTALAIGFFTHLWTNFGISLENVISDNEGAASLIVSMGFLFLAILLKKLPIAHVFFITHIYLLAILLVLNLFFEESFPLIICSLVFAFTLPMLYLEYRYLLDSSRQIERKE